MATPLPSTRFKLTCKGCGTGLELGPPTHEISMVQSGVNVDPAFVCPNCCLTGVVRQSEVQWRGFLKVRGNLVDALMSYPAIRPAGIAPIEIVPAPPEPAPEAPSTPAETQPSAGAGKRPSKAKATASGEPDPSPPIG